jgi:hypothetical protein
MSLDELFDKPKEEAKSGGRFDDLVRKPEVESETENSTKAQDPEENIMEIITPENPELHALAVKVEEARNGRDVGDIPVNDQDPYWTAVHNLRQHYQGNR